MPKLITARSKLAKATRKQEPRLTGEGCSKRRRLLLLGFGVALMFLQCVSYMADVSNLQDLSRSIARSLTFRGGPAVANGPTVGLTVVHCNEDWSRMSWLDEIPSHWKLVIYETCGQTISKAFSRPWKNAGPEECTGYLQTMIDQYDNLPDINIFFQSDGLLGRGRPQKFYTIEHSPFKTIQELINATMEYSPSWNESHFLHYGPKFLRILNVNSKENYIDYNAREVLDTMQMPYLKIHENNTALNATSSMTRSGACFAVSPDRIRAKPVELYKQLRDSLYDAFEEGGSRKSRPRCCALEQLWHAILGSPYILPTNETVDHLWDAKMNFYEGRWEEELKRQKEQQQQQQSNHSTSSSTGRQ